MTFGMEYFKRFGDIKQFALLIDTAVDRTYHRRGQIQHRSGHSLSVKILSFEDMIRKFTLEQIHECGRRGMLGSVTDRGSLRFSRQMTDRIREIRANKQTIRQQARIQSIAEHPSIEIIDKNSPEVSKDTLKKDNLEKTDKTSENPQTTPVANENENISVKDEKIPDEDENTEFEIDERLENLELEEGMEESSYEEFLEAIEEALVSLPDEKKEEKEDKFQGPKEKEYRKPEKREDVFGPKTSIVEKRLTTPKRNARDDERHLDEKAAEERHLRQDRRKAKEKFEKEKSEGDIAKREKRIEDSV